MTKKIPPFTVHQAAEWLGVTPRRVQVLCTAGRIPGAVKHGREWMIPSNFKVSAPPRARKG